jgi:hypothetical protein
MLEARGHEVVQFGDEREALDQIKTDIGIEAVIPAPSSDTCRESSCAGRPG